MRNPTFIVRQGDVMVFAVSSLPKAVEPVARESGRVVLAHGEATGHCHAIKSEKAALFRDPKLNAMFLTVTGEAVALEHDEHGTIDIPPGNYQVVRQRSYEPEGIRQVQD